MGEPPNNHTTSLVANLGPCTAGITAEFHVFLNRRLRYDRGPLWVTSGPSLSYQLRGRSREHSGHWFRFNLTMCVRSSTDYHTYQTLSLGVSFSS